MAKTDTRKGARKADAKRAEKRIPKTVAGVKLPKDLRRAGDAILARAATPEGKAMIAGGLSMAVAGIAAMTERSRKPADVAPSTPRTDESTTGTAPTPGGIRDPQAIADAVGGAVEAAIGRILKRF